jgi:hypothetical protein
MGLLAMPLILLFWYSRKAAGRTLSPFAAALALILGITMVDMLLNDTLVPFVWLIAGAALGYAERHRYDDSPELSPAPQKRARAVMPPVIGSPPAKEGKRTVL